MRQSHSPCIIKENRVYVSIFTILSLIGGSFCANGNRVHIFMNCAHYRIPAEQFVLINGYLYTEITNIAIIGFEVKIEGDTISVRYSS